MGAGSNVSEGLTTPGHYPKAAAASYAEASYVGKMKQSERVRWTVCKCVTTSMCVCSDGEKTLSCVLEVSGGQLQIPLQHQINNSSTEMSENIGFPEII